MKYIIKTSQSLFLFFILFSCQNNSVKESKGNSLLTSAEKKQSSNSNDNAGYFYFELVPTSNLPYYFSDVKHITYIDNLDLGRQQDDYMQKLRNEATKDGQDQNNYNQKSSTEKSTFKDADDELTSNVQDLKNSGITVVKKTLN